MISIIMPTYNRFDIAEKTIQLTTGINTDVEFELIVVNDGNPLPFSIHHPKLKMVSNPKKGVAAARNYGVGISKYPVLFFIDDDMWITARTLTIIADLYENKKLNEAYYNLNWIYPDTLQNKLACNKIGRFILNANYHTLEGRSAMVIDYTKTEVPHEGVGSCSFCISRQNFLKVGGYNEQIQFQGEDTELAKRLSNLHIEARLLTEISCYHNQEDRLDIKGYTDRIYRGFISQHRAGMVNISGYKKFLLQVFIPFYFIFEFLFKLMPNLKIFDIITFKIIGILSVLSFAKALRDA